MFGFFGGNNNQQQNNQPNQPQQPQQQQQQQPSASGNTVQNPDIKPEQQNGTNQLPPNPLDVYAKLWETTNQGPQDTPPEFRIDPKVLGEVSSSMDFTKDIPPELMQQATNGDMNSLIQLMNHVGRAAYSASLNHGATLTDKFVGARSQYDLKSVGSKVKQEMVTSSFTDIPNSSHPVVKTELKRIATAMQQQHPDAHPAEIVQKTKEYWTLIQQATNPNAGGQGQQQQQPAETDWDKFF